MARAGSSVAGDPRDRAEHGAVPDAVEQFVEHAVAGAAGAVVRTMSADQQQHGRDEGGERGFLGARGRR